MKINQKLGLSFGAVIFLALALGYCSIYFSKKSLEQAIGGTSAILAQEILDKIDRHIYSRIEGIQRIFSDMPLQKSLTDSGSGRPEDINKHIQEQDALWRAQPAEAITPFMAQIIDNQISARLKEIILFYERRYGYKVFNEIFITDIYGANIAQSGKTSDYYQADEAWWQKAKQDGVYVGSVSFDESSRAYSIEIGLRIDDEAGNFISVVKAIMNIEGVVRIIQESKSAEQINAPAEFLLLSGDGKVIYSTAPFVIFGDADVNLLSKIRGHDRERGYFLRTTDWPAKEKKLTAYAYSNGYRDYKGRGSVLVIDYRANDIFAPVTKLRNLLFVLIIAAAAVLVFIAIFTSRAISKAVASLSVENLMRRKAQEDLHKAYRQLEEAQGQLIQAEKLEAIGRLASGVAHEVRNPLGIIKQGIDFLKNKFPSADPRLPQTIEIMDRNIIRADTIIRGLVDFSRAGELVLIPQDINMVLEKSILLVSHKIEFSKVKLVRDLADGLPRVTVDPLKMEQVFVNLFLNAMQAMPSGGVLSIKTSLLELTEAKKGVGNRSDDYFRIGENAVVVEIEDTGCGIPKDNLERIFDPFFTTKNPGDGTGLGLAVTNNIITMHKGLIEAQSKVGFGTTFRVTLKAA